MAARSLNSFSRRARSFVGAGAADPETAASSNATDADRKRISHLLINGPRVMEVQDECRRAGVMERSTNALSSAQCAARSRPGRSLAVTSPCEPRQRRQRALESAVLPWVVDRGERDRRRALPPLRRRPRVGDLRLPRLPRRARAQPPPARGSLAAARPQRRAVRRTCSPPSRAWSSSRRCPPRCATRSSPWKTNVSTNTLASTGGASRAPLAPTGARGPSTRASARSRCRSPATCSRSASPATHAPSSESCSRSASRERSSRPTARTRSSSST